ncbi:PLP-dependent transferase [Fulvivirga sp. M361]|uniref:trans-sulfuration enzyme family protein n=1 Tax=Fulvivirga sp. M361 TaxID=2594266 RepID=UPI001179A52F|nr:PLP-dependent aspartate aminotransferase family protein [Fulvivirga sp. M361]TRX58702.1 PLP-dependent transferase [Fulvivirga sp. M361]
MNSKKTQCIHSGTLKDDVHQGTVSPIYTSTAYDYVNVDINAYPRYFNTPNQQAVKNKISALENAEDGLVFSSGMAAITTVLFSLLKKGDHAIFQNDLYGGTHYTITTQMERFGIEYTFVDSMDWKDYEPAIKASTKLIYVETPSNPLLKIIDLKALTNMARSKKIITLIDNTFASPINQNPIDQGVDIVMHSGTKYLGGHSDICCGAALASRSLVEGIWDSAIKMGGSLDAQSCYLLERSLKTLALRVNQQNQNAQQISEFLSGHEKISNVYYPGLTNHPGHDIAKAQMSGFGGMLSFEIRTDPNAFVKKLELIKSAMSLGGVESTITCPAQTSHSKISAEERLKVGISDGLLRVSAGIEDTDDLIADLEQALTMI